MTPRALALGAGLLCLACRPLPPPVPPDAGMGTLRGVVFERLHGDHRQLRVEAPRADLDINGTQLVLHDPHGEAQEVADGGVYRWRAQSFTANLHHGRYTMEGVVVRDREQRELSTPRVTLDADGGVLLADPPVRLSGPNYQLESAGGARAEMGSQELTLEGPVEARAWPPDSGVTRR